MAAWTMRGSYWAGLATMGAVLLCGGQRAHALIEGGEGNSPVNDPGWPEGAAAVFNVEGRVAYWVGPPFGGGEWHAECRGDAAAFNRVLQDFAKIRAPGLKLVVHDGIGRSFWLNPNNEPEKREAAKIDWSFTVWEPERWKHLQSLPEQVRPNRGPDGEAPAPAIDVYVGFNINWADVRVPAEIEVVDERLEAHGFSLDDGTVLEGTVARFDAEERLAAIAHLERIDRKAGKYEYTRIRSARTDPAGRWVMKSVPAGWYRVVVDAPDYVPRIAGFQQLDGSPHWAAMPTALARGASVSGQVIDEVGEALSNATVRLDDVVIGGDVYKTGGNWTATTDAEGRFEFSNVPRGRTSVRVSKSGYVRPGLGEAVDVPAENVVLEMQPAAHARIVVDFGDKPRPAGYLVEMQPEGGNVVGSYGGSANLPEDNRYEFRNVPPGKYVFFGRPNPGSTDEETERVTVELRGGETASVTLKAK